MPKYDAIGRSIETEFYVLIGKATKFEIEISLTMITFRIYNHAKSCTH